MNNSVVSLSDKRREIKNYLHLYLGCQMEYKSHHEPQDATYVLTLDNIKEAIEFDERPILRPLSSMTEEEMKEFGVLEQNYEICRTKQGWNGARFSPEDFKWLLSKGFDLFGLIESGLAISSTTEKETIKE